MRVTVKVPCLVLAVVLAGCSVFDPDLLPRKDEVTPPPPGQCGRQPPPPPPATDDPGDDVELMVFALRGVVLDQQGAGRSWSEIGYDLDCYTTSHPTNVIPDRHECVPPRALPPPEGGFTVDNPPDPLSLDGVEGIDNVFGDQFYALVEASVARVLEDYFGEPKSFEAAANEAQLAGKGTVLIGVEGWNGQLNDRRMTVWIAQAVAGTPCTEKDLVELNEEFDLVYVGTDDPAPPPAWEGDDCWWLRDDAFVTQSNPPQLRIIDDLGYMRDGVAVMKLQDRQPIDFFAGPVGARTILTGAVSTSVFRGENPTEQNPHGDLSDPWSIRLARNIVAGRWHLNDLTLSATHVGVCDAQQSFLQGQLDRMADLRSNPNDPHALDQPCNAISMGVRFDEGVPGRLANGTPEDSRKAGPPLPILCD
jgi:hypothetical protein